VVAKLPRRPYLLRALTEWILDSGHTPYVLVDATQPGVVVPPEHVKDGRIVLNLSPAAVRGLEIGPHAVTCDSRFGGRAFALYLPMASLVAVYARETGEGMVFEAETFAEPEPPPTRGPTGPEVSGPAATDGKGNPPPRGGHLKRIK
jgi:stringent starvation protein B